MYWKQTFLTEIVCIGDKDALRLNNVAYNLI